MTAPFVRLGSGRYGQVLYNPNDQYIGRSIELYGEVHELEIAFLRSLCGPGAYVFDIGANIGGHTVALAMHVGERGRVLAFEPQRIVFQTLCGNVALAGLSNVEAYEAALGASAGTVLVPEIDYTHPANYGSIEVSRFAQGRPVPVRTLDEFAGLPRIDLIKIDVEGMECDVLSGGRAAIAAFRPLLYVENDREERSEELVSLLASLGYRMFWHLPPLYNPQNVNGNAENVFGAIVSRNVLCVPAETPLEITGFEEIFATKGRGGNRGSFDRGVAEDERGRAAFEAGDYAAAERHFQTAARLIPDRADPLANLTFLYHALGRVEEAIAAGEAAIAIEPAHRASRVNLALSYLLAGDYERGLREYEWRPFERGVEGLPRWDGAALEGKRLLVARDQGLGDFIALSRFFEPLRARAGALLGVEVPPELRALYARFPGIDEVCDEHARAYDGYAAYLPAGSMLGELGIAASTVPSPVPYLHADPVKIARFARQFASLGAARRVGIAWAGSPEHKRDRHRSCALAEFGALAGIDGVAFVSLQKGAALEQAASPPAGLDLLRIDDRLETLDDTAAAIAALDLVICVDTAVGHLAGAMGKPVWLLNGFGNYWLWGLRKATTPWYPSMRLFHQDRPGDWASIFRDVRAALEERD